jgi:peptidoglycan/LPS O-acetylase OafA/YrhL
VGRRDDLQRAPDGEARAGGALTAARLVADGAVADAGHRAAGASVPILDSFRGVAALGILGYHCWLLSGEPLLRNSPVRDVLSSGFLAVSLFFVLSGFVLYLPVARRGGTFGSVAAYARRRMARVLPAYYVVLIVCLLAYPLMVTVAIGEHVTASSLLAHALLLQQEARLIPGYSGSLGFGVDPVVWTLSLEALFYVSLPFVAAIFWRRPWQAIALAIAVGVVARLLLDGSSSSGDGSVLLSSFPVHLADFAAGMGAAMLYVRWQERDAPVWRPAPWLVVTVAVAGAGAALVALAAVGGPDATAVRDGVRANAPLMALLPFAFAAAIAGFALAPAAVRRPLELAPVRWLGTVSYGVFLVHYPVLLFGRTTLDILHNGSTEAFVRLTAYALPVSLLLGWLSWVAIERPARRLARSRAVVASG